MITSEIRKVEPGQVALSDESIKYAILIREVEQALLDLFSKGLLHGTVHTCVGQEFSALAFAGQLDADDFVFSNHRCHGHYLARHDDCEGLIAELLGRAGGVCGGVGGSQHLHRGSFFSNGVQGGIVPVAAGMALAEKLLGRGRVGIVFIGDGTLGEGVVYETMNIVSKLSLPLLIVCEDNHYAQSTRRTDTLAGDIVKRAAAFDVRTFAGSTSRPAELFALARSAIEMVQTEVRPVFFHVDTCRLNAHSKGDDDRAPDEIRRYRDSDFLTGFAQTHAPQHDHWRSEARERIQAAIQQAERQPVITLADYAPAPASSPAPLTWHALTMVEERQGKLINAFFHEAMAKNPRVVFIGEDVLSPYGGAFKIAQGLSDKFPDRVISTPISEAAITGIANGLALRGFRPFVEIMFGDFITLAFDQIVNHAAKFHQMYHGQINCPLVLRTPMGGRRGYGPTHSQTLDKLLIGIDGIQVVALNQLIPPGIVYDEILRADHPVIVLENKTDYVRKIAVQRSRNFVYEHSSEALPTARIRPRQSRPNLTLVTYGGAVQPVLDVLDRLFEEMDLLPDVIIPTSIHPLNIEPILASVRETQRLFVVEDGSVSGGFGSEAIAAVMERVTVKILARRIGALSVAIPATKELEMAVLPGEKRIFDEIRRALV